MVVPDPTLAVEPQVLVERRRHAQRHLHLPSSVLACDDATGVAAVAAVGGAAKAPVADDRHHAVPSRSARAPPCRAAPSIAGSTNAPSARVPTATSPKRATV